MGNTVDVVFCNALVGVTAVEGECAHTKDCRFTGARDNSQFLDFSLFIEGSSGCLLDGWEESKKVVSVEFEGVMRGGTLPACKHVQR